MLINLILLLLCFVFHIFLYRFKTFIFGNQFLDAPNLDRKIHKVPTYLIGGHLIFLSYLLFLIFSFNIEFYQKIFLLVGITSFFVVGIIDDLKDLKPSIRIILIITIYYILTNFDKSYLLNEIYLETFQRSINFGNYAFLISVLCILLLVNAINLIDGINGLAMMIFLIFYFFLNYYLNVDMNLFLTIFYFLILFNIYKGKYFLGNSGSLLIGVLIGLLAIKYYNISLSYNVSNPSENIVILFLIPGLDMLRLFIQRILNRKNPFSADKSHLHHLFIDKFSLNKTLFFYFFSISFTSYIAFENYVPKIYIISFIIISYFSILFLFHRRRKKINNE